ncbi:hypothetical protein [Actinoplanes sp. NPDC051859]|uniref:hypothetical protein n=1 Tax=Actinoplanes sp. NPDC051859 TaxID=3363909 RepID=UPI0037AAF911
MAERTVDVLVVRWYERRRDSPPIVPRWLAAAREHLPAAMPTRFGSSEPLRGRFDRVGEAGLLQAYAKADSLLAMDGEPPIHHATFAAAASSPCGPIDVHSLHAEVGVDDERVRRFALALTHPGTVYVSASIAGAMILDGRELVGPPERREEPYLAPFGDWLGLPPQPPAWCFFGPAYASRVRRRIDGQAVAGGLLSTGGPWVDERLQARLAEPEWWRRNARRMPRGLRRSGLRWLLDNRRTRVR